MHRLAYSFGWDDSEVVPPGSSLIEIDLIEQPDGTLLCFTHTGLPNAEQCAGHAEGWAHYLGRLAGCVSGSSAYIVGRDIVGDSGKKRRLDGGTSATPNTGADRAEYVEMDGSALRMGKGYY